MTQENGMPACLIEFQAWWKSEKKLVKVIAIDFSENCITTQNAEGFVYSVYGLNKLILLQAIGATDSSDPPQELYLGDVVEIEFADRKRTIAEIIWREFAVKLRFFSELKNEIHWDFHTFKEFGRDIKKLGSRYDPKLRGVLEKAGLEKASDG